MLHKPDHGNTRSEGGGARSDSETDNGDRLGARSDPPDRPSVRQLLIHEGGHDQNHRMDELVNTGTLLAHIPVRAVAIDARKVLERTLRVSLHRLAALVPVGGAHLTVLVLRMKKMR